MGTIATVTISTDTFSVYALTSAAVTDANSYFNGQLGASSAAWTAATTDNKGRALAMASQFLDRALTFSGTKTVAAQPREWPRDGASECGVAITDGTTPDAMAYATFELAALLLIDSTVADSSGQGSNVKRAKAGSAEVEFFTSTIGSELDVRMPAKVWDYVRCLVDGAGSTIGIAFASGTDEESSFGTTDFDRCEGF